ncbi:MAG TPA: ThuA domain-containing protein [Casimicrobiaceae bacterium]|nr:ThuA domain-containing protein [Casimicrobiaceae bacterium]
MGAPLATAGSVVLLPGHVRVPDKHGHHDYRAGCALLADLLQQNAGVSTVTVWEGWPADDAVLDGARTLVFYTGGLGKHALLQSAQRIDRMQQLVDRGIGLVMIHQAVRYPPEIAERAISWIGGAYVRGTSNAGHWKTHHRRFPDHPVARGVQPWSIRDGWHNHIRFVEGMHGVTPLVWSSKQHGGAPEGGAADVVSWTYDRPGGGRAFCFTGLDAHTAWSKPGVRQLVVNGILWTAGFSVPSMGARCAVDEATLRGYLTARGYPGQWAVDGLVRRWRRLLR